MKKNVLIIIAAQYPIVSIFVPPHLILRLGRIFLFRKKCNFAVRKKNADGQDA